jgi:flagellar biosynthesis protein FliQ
MTPTQFIMIFQEMMTTMMWLSAPVLIVSLVVGVAISIVQAVTQIQESTLTFVPKVIACIAVLMLLAPWMVDKMLSHTTQQFALLGQLSKPAKASLSEGSTKKPVSNGAAGGTP